MVISFHVRTQQHKFNSSQKYGILLSLVLLFCVIVLISITQLVNLSRLRVKRLMQHININNLDNPHQTEHKPGNSTESASLHIKTRPTHQRINANLYPQERQLNKASEPSFHLEGGVKLQI